MPLAKILNFGVVDKKILDRSLFRYVSFDDLLSLVENERNRLTKITKWKEHDPYENVMFEFPIQNGRETIYLEDLSNHYYAQCWSLEKESDIMWQLYRHRYEKKGGVVKLETTVGRLLESCKKENFSFIGKVVYKKKRELIMQSHQLRDNIDKILFLDRGSGRGIAQELLVKRFAYRFEREVRLLLPRFDFKENNSFPSHYEYNIELGNFVKKIVFDPKMSLENFNKSRKKIHEINKKINVIKSNLYFVDEEKFRIKY